MMNKVSIIVPVYNSEKYLERCLNSIINQTYKNIEVILIDDGSKDNSYKIMEKYNKKYHEIIKIYKQKNVGVAITRNKGITLATGKYIMFIDNDDYIDKTYIENYVNEIEKNECDILIGGYKRVDSSNKILYKMIPNEKYDWSKYLIVSPWAKMYKKESIIKTKSKFLDYYIAEDIIFELNLYTNNLNIKYINNLEYNWFYNNSSVSNTTQRGFNENIDILFILDELLKFRKENSQEKELVNYFIYRYGVWYLLFSGRNSTHKDFLEEYNKIFNWLVKNIDMKIKIPKGEPIKFKVIILLMQFFNKFNLIKLFSRIYCKGDYKND